MERQQKAYKGVIDYFKKKIMDGELRPGEKLPPERDIAERLNVSRNSYHGYDRSDLFTAGIRKLHYM